MARYYTGIGSRKTPEAVQQMMTKLAAELAGKGYILRSGGAQGADKAFERGTPSNQAHIYIPWHGFEGSDSPLAGVDTNALAMAAQYHPNWAACSSGAQKLHARNCYQVLGRDLNTPSAFVICWTPGGKDQGGTAQALRIARVWGIRIYNLGHPDHVEGLRSLLTDMMIETLSWLEFKS